MDGSQLHLDAAQEFAQQHGVQTPLTLVQADLRKPLEFADNMFDAAWCADVLWSNLFPDPVAVVQELARVVKPEGVIGIFFGNFYRALYLPGYRRLEALAGSAENLRWQNDTQMTSAASIPSSYERALQWLQKAGLHACTLTVHPILYQQPLPPEVRDYLASYVFAEAFGPAVQSHGAEVGMSDAERDYFRELTTPDSPHYLLDQPDYYCLQTAVLVMGRV